MKHYITFRYGRSYERVLRRVAQDNDSVEVEQFIKQLSDSGKTYYLLTLNTFGVVSERTERQVNSLDEVIMSTFNLEN